jgi:hypothetical protein
MAKNCIKRLNKVLDTLDNDEVSDLAFNYYRNNTPLGNPRLWKSKAPKNYRPGNAKRRTRKTGNDIDANYAYAVRLDNGWSKQAPNGMTEPTIEHIRKYVLQKLGVKI